MKKLAIWIVVLASVLMVGIAYSPTAAYAIKPTDGPTATDKPELEKRAYCHANSGASEYVYHFNSAWDAHFANNGSPLAGHELDFYTTEGNKDCGANTPTPLPPPSATPIPSDTPTATATDVPPTAEPSATPVPNTPTVSETLTEEPTDEPTETFTPVSTDTPDATATSEPTAPPADTQVAPEDTPEPTPSGAPTVKPRRQKECDVTEVGALFELLGPNGQHGWLGSYQRNPWTNRWAIPNVAAQNKCLGWTAVGIGRVRLISRDCTGHWNIVTVSCTGGAPCAGAYGKD